MKLEPGRRPSAMLTVRACQALRAYVERKREAERGQLRVALMERPPCVIYVKGGSCEPAQLTARGAALGPHAVHADPLADIRARRAASHAEYEPEAG